MKNLDLRHIICLILLLASHYAVIAQELFLYNQEGNAAAYFDLQDEDQTIYLINGKATAYLFLDKPDDPFLVYGFNGVHIGWYKNGMLFDNEGFLVACIEEAGCNITRGEPFMLPFKQLKPFKSFRDIPSFKPSFIEVYSKRLLGDFLLDGLR
jgi:hypothetical protein